MSELQQKYASAARLVSDRDFNGAIQIFMSMDRTAKVQANLGILFLQTQEWERAHEFFTRAVQQDPYLAIAQFGRGISVLRQNKLSKAIDDFTTCIKLLRNKNQIDYNVLGLPYILYESEVFYNRSLAYLAMKDSKKAKADAAAATKAMSNEMESPTSMYHTRISKFETQLKSNPSKIKLIEFPIFSIPAVVFTHKPVGASKPPDKPAPPVPPARHRTPAEIAAAYQGDSLPPPRSAAAGGAAPPTASELAAQQERAVSRATRISQNRRVSARPVRKKSGPLAAPGALDMMNQTGGTADRGSISLVGGRAVAGALPLDRPDMEFDHSTGSDKRSSGSRRSRSSRNGQAGFARPKSGRSSAPSQSSAPRGVQDRLALVNDVGLRIMMLQLYETVPEAAAYMDTRLDMYVRNHPVRPQVDTIKIRGRVRQTLNVIQETVEARVDQSWAHKVQQQFAVLEKFVSRAGNMAINGDSKGALTVLEALSDEYNSRYWAGANDDLAQTLTNDDADFQRHLWAKWAEVLNRAGELLTRNECLLWSDRAMRLDVGGFLNTLLNDQWKGYARDALMHAFTKNPTLVVYRRIMQLITDSTTVDKIRADLMASCELRMKIDIFLNDGLVDEAVNLIRSADIRPSEDKNPEEERESLLRHVAHNVASSRPKWVIETAKTAIPLLLRWIIEDAKIFFDVERFSFEAPAHEQFKFLEETRAQLTMDAEENLDTGPDLIRKVLRWFRSVKTAFEAKGQLLRFNEFINDVSKIVDPMVDDCEELLYIMRDCCTEEDGEWLEIRNMLTAIDDQTLEIFVRGYM